MRDRNLSKPIAWVVAGILLFLFSGSALLAQNPQVTPALTPDLARISSATAEVLREVSQLRGLGVKHPVKSGLKSRDEISRMVLKDLEEENTPEEIRASQLLLVKLGLIPENFDLKSYLVKLYAEQIAGFYEPRTKEFYLADWIPLDEQRPVMAHELTHALQDQHFSLSRFQLLARGQSDAELAIRAMIEGEATDVMLDWAYRSEKLDITRFPPLKDALQSMSGNNGKEFPLLDRAPEVIKQNLLFPYFYGAGFVQAVVKAASWTKVTEGYQRPPLSTEQIMHPEKFLAYEKPWLIQLPPLAPVLGRDWKLIDEDVIGEFNLLIALKQFIPAAAASRAAEGWAGDRYALIENQETHAIAMISYSVWDTDAHAAEYFDAEIARLKARYPGAVAESSSEDIVRLRTKEGEAAIEVKDNAVIVLDGVPEATVPKLLSRAWTAKKSEMQAPVLGPSK